MDDKVAHVVCDCWNESLRVNLAFETDEDGFIEIGVVTPQGDAGWS